jgi:hypothetical protein
MDLTIDFSAMGYVEDFDISSRVINGINNSVISCSDTVKIAIGELLGSEWSWVDFKLEQLWQDSILQTLRKLFKLALCASCYFN